MNIYAIVLVCLLQYVHTQTVRNVQIGASASFTCYKVVGSDILWDRERHWQGGSIGIRGVVQQGHSDKYTLQGGITSTQRVETLTIVNITLDDDDTFRCSRLYQHDYDTFKLNVLVKPRLAKINPPERRVNQGSHMTITCSIGYSKPAATIKWFMKTSAGSRKENLGRVMNTPSQAANGTFRQVSILTINKVSRDMFGATIFCHGVISDLDYEVFLNHTVNMNLMPIYPYLTGDLGPATEGHKVKLTCHADDAKPEANITWYSQGKRVEGLRKSVHTERETVSVTSTIHFIATREDQGSRFLCLVTNKVLVQSNQRAMNETFKLVVHYKPVVTVDENPLIRYEDSSSLLECSFHALPVPSRVAWLHQGVILQDTYRRNVTNTNTRSIVRIRSLSYEDKGTYHCEVTNSVGTMSSSPVLLNVLHSPVCVKYQKIKYGAVLGQTVDITCHVEANPINLIKFQWNSGGSWFTIPGVREPAMPYLATSRMQYTVRDERDYKEVQCRALNGIRGLPRTCPFYIMKPGPAEAPTHCTTSNVTWGSAHVQCQEEYDGGSPATYLLHTMKDTEVTMTSSNSKPEFNLTKLVPNTTYQYRVCSTNKNFSQSFNCTELYNITTDNYNGTFILDNPVTFTQVAVVAGSVAGALAFLVIMGVLFAAAFATRRKRIKHSNVMSQTPSISVWDKSTRYGTDTPYSSYREDRKVNIQTFDNTGFSDDDPRYQSVDEVSKMTTLTVDKPEITPKAEDQYAIVQKKVKHGQQTSNNTDKDSTL